MNVVALVALMLFLTYLGLYLSVLPGSLVLCYGLVIFFLGLAVCVTQLEDSQ